MKLVFKNHVGLVGYNCQSCNTYNDILTLHCNYCKVCNLSPEIIRQSYAIRILRAGEFIGMKNDDIVELHMQFFNHERVMIKDLDTIQMHERREELRKIAFEAKARLTAHDEEERLRNANRSAEQKQWLLSSTTNDPNVTDAINAVKTRKARMSSADKNLAVLQNLGIANADALVAAMIKNKTGAAISSTASRVLVDKSPYPLSNSCKMNLHHACTGIREDEKVCECKCHKPKVMFNPASLSFNK